MNPQPFAPPSLRTSPRTGAGYQGWAAYMHTYIHSHRHTHSHNQLSCRLLELPGISHRQVVPALLDLVVLGLPEVAQCMTEDPGDLGYRPTRICGQWQLQSFSNSNGDKRYPVEPPGVKGQGIATQHHSDMQQARAHPMGARQQSPYHTISYHTIHLGAWHCAAQCDWQCH